jgi:hypothetical protein
MTMPPPASEFYVKGTALLYWDNTPTKAERHAVEGCLR